MNKIKTLAVVAIVAVIIIAGVAIFVSGGNNNKTGNESFTVTDYLGREVAITSTERIVSVSVNPTAILCGLGVASNIVGVSSDSDIYNEDPYVIGETQDDFPQAISTGISNGSITPLGGMYHMAAETIASVESDIVICDDFGTNQDIRDALDTLGITYIVTASANSLQDIYDTMELLGKVVGKESAAERMISEMESTIDKIADWCVSIVDNELNGQRYNVVIMNTETTAMGPERPAGNVISRLQVNNLFTGGSTTISNESILEKNPDILIYQNLEMGGVASPAKFIEDLYNDPVMGKMKAAENGLIFALQGGAKNAASYYNQGFVRSYAIYAMFIYKDYLTFDIPDVLDTNNYTDYISQFWEMINA